MSKKGNLLQLFNILDKCTYIPQEDRLMVRQALKEGNQHLMKMLKQFRKSNDLHNLQIQLRKQTALMKKHETDLSQHLRTVQRSNNWHEMVTNRSESKSTEPRMLPHQPKRVGCNSVSLSRSQRHTPMQSRNLDLTNSVSSLKVRNIISKRDKENINYINLQGGSNVDDTKIQQRVFRVNLIDTKQPKPADKLLNSSAEYFKEGLVLSKQGSLVSLMVDQSTVQKLTISCSIRLDDECMKQSQAESFSNEQVILKYNAEEIYGKASDPSYQQINYENLCIDQLWGVAMSRPTSQTQLRVNSNEVLLYSCRSSIFQLQDSELQSNLMTPRNNLLREMQPTVSVCTSIR